MGCFCCDECFTTGTYSLLEFTGALFRQVACNIANGDISTFSTTICVSACLGVLIAFVQWRLLEWREEAEWRRWVADDDKQGDEAQQSESEQSEPAQGADWVPGGDDATTDSDSYGLPPTEFSDFELEPDKGAILLASDDDSETDAAHPHETDSTAFEEYPLKVAPGGSAAQPPLVLKVGSGRRLPEWHRRIRRGEPYPHRIDRDLFTDERSQSELDEEYPPIPEPAVDDDGDIVGHFGEDGKLVLYDASDK